LESERNLFEKTTYTVSSYGDNETLSGLWGLTQKRKTIEYMKHRIFREMK
jgi:hypothetical protein